MTNSLAMASAYPERQGFAFQFEALRRSSVWLIFASAFVVIFEPAPTDIFFVCAFLLYLRSGLRITTAIMPLFLLLLLYNISGLICLIAVESDSKANFFVLTSTYMAIASIFFASFIAYKPMEGMDLIKSGYVFGATIAAIIGLLGYSNLGGFGHILVKFGASNLAIVGRATGAFKDPNVFSTYLVFPTVLLIQGFVIGASKRPLLNTISLALMFTALFLAFSRGAWINVLMSTFLMVSLTFMLTSSLVLRGRIILYTVIGVVVLSAIVIFLLSIPSVRDLFLDRFTLLKSYDSGDKGRFGNQLNAIPLLLNLPLGFGPLQFHTIFGIDPHNTFLNAFASYGWVGGVTYFTLVITTLTIGLRTVVTKSPLQNNAILVYSCLVSVMFQGVQIDTEHWRHFYWMLGMMWGLFAATLYYTSSKNSDYLENSKPKMANA